jgi:hypothetical protein
MKNNFALTLELVMTKKRKATLKDVAKEAGVNFTLVSKFLTGNPQARMTDETRKRIELAVKKLDYRPSASARALRNGKSKTIGLVVRDLTNSYFAHIADTALRELRQKGYQLLIALDDDEDAVKSLVMREVDGIIHLGKKAPDTSTIPCPVAVNDTNVRGAIEINPDLSNSLDCALKNLQGKIAGLFFESSTWSKEFDSATKRVGKKNTFKVILPFNQAERREELRKICQKKPDGIVASGWRTFLILSDLIKKEFKGYSPQIVLQANCKGEFFKDKNIIGVIHSSTTELICKTCQAIIAEIESATPTPKKLKNPTIYIDANSPDFAKLITKEFSLT